jgi:hypothetical protein
MQKLISVFTRCNNRPSALYANIESLSRQTMPDYEQVFIVDGSNRGIAWANMQLGANAWRADGEYVMVLDDDDAMACDDAISEIADAVADHNHPDMVLWRMDHGEGRILPDEHVWQAAPVEGRIGMSCWAVRRDVWLTYADRWPNDTEADYKWLSAVWSNAPRRVWIDKVLTRCQNGRSWGATE